MGGKSEKCKKSRSLSFLALAISRFNPILFALCLMEAAQSQVLRERVLQSILIVPYRSAPISRALALFLLLDSQE